jgi:hypothetical protein
MLQRNAGVRGFTAPEPDLLPYELFHLRVVKNITTDRHLSVVETPLTYVGEFYKAERQNTMQIQTDYPGGASWKLIKRVFWTILLGDLFFDGLGWGLDRLGIHGLYTSALWAGLTLLALGLLAAWKGLVACATARRFRSETWEITGGLVFGAGLFLALIGMMVLAA